MSAFPHSRPGDTRVITTDVELIPYFALIRAAKDRGMSRTTLASELLTLGMRVTGLLPEGTAVHLGNSITALPAALRTPSPAIEDSLARAGL